MPKSSHGQRQQKTRRRRRSVLGAELVQDCVPIRQTKRRDFPMATAWITLFAARGRLYSTSPQYQRCGLRKRFCQAHAAGTVRKASSDLPKLFPLRLSRKLSCRAFLSMDLLTGTPPVPSLQDACQTTYSTLKATGAIYSTPFARLASTVVERHSLLWPCLINIHSLHCFHEPPSSPTLR